MKILLDGMNQQQIWNDKRINEFESNLKTICKTERKTNKPKKAQKLVVVKFPEGKERKRCKVFEEMMFPNLPNLMKKNCTSKKLSKFLVEST